MNDMVKIIQAIDMGRSIVHDHSAENIKRLCWLLYCSTNTVHESVFGMEMTEHYEILLMDKLGVYYKEDDTKVGKGCVSMLLNKMLNDYRGHVSNHLKHTGNVRFPMYVRIHQRVKFRLKKRVRYFGWARRYRTETRILL